jgi:ribosomal-protein-alanine N-acetyltransferase
MKTPLPVHIRWMIRRDMPRVLEIEAESFSSPWTEREFIRCLRQRNIIGMVAEEGDTVIGYMLYELHKSYIHVRNFAVASDFRRQGVGRKMAEKLKDKVHAHPYRDRIAVDVSDANLTAHLFWKANGFKAIGIVQQPFEDCDNDAYSFVYRESGVAVEC